MQNNFRTDINFLRALAVILVVLFHFNVVVFSAGFIGVDIFFVISGFLMTSIIYRNINADTFSYKKFILDRINRIVPPLAFLLIVFLCIGWVLLLPDDYIKLAKHSLSSISFTSNYVYMNESGYFDGLASDKPLLHTWSLSLEWQFYLAIPFIYMLFSRIELFRNRQEIVLLSLIISSFLYAMYLSDIDKDLSYYSVFSRCWELLCGGLIYFISLKVKGGNTFLVLGGLLMICGLVFIEPQNAWPSLYTLLPVVGTCLILLAQKNNIVFSNNILSVIGKSSYSIYLWHWFVVYILFYFYKTSVVYLIFGIVASFILGYLSYRYIECGLSKKIKQLPVRIQIKCYAIGFVSIAIIPLLIFSYDGFKDRFNSNVYYALQGKKDQNPLKSSCFLQGANIPIGCEYGTGDLKAIVIGDSHAQSIVRSVEKVFNGNGRVLDWTAILCGTFEGAEFRSGFRYKCGSVIEHILKEKELYSDIPIIISNRLNLYLHGGGSYDVKKRIIYVGQQKDHFDMEHQQSLRDSYLSTVCKLSQNNPVYLLNQIPEQNFNVPSALAKKIVMGSKENIFIKKEDYLLRSQLAHEIQAEAVKRCGVKIIDVSETLCDSDKCYGSDSGKPLYYDYDHLTLTGAEKLLPLFQKALADYK